MISTVTEKGQVTIPKAIRMFLKINPSDKVDFTVEGDKVILKPIKSLRDFRGAVPSKGKGNLEEERNYTKTIVSERVIKEME